MSYFLYRLIDMEHERTKLPLSSQHNHILFAVACSSLAHPGEGQRPSRRGGNLDLNKQGHLLAANFKADALQSRWPPVLVSWRLTGSKCQQEALKKLLLPPSSAKVEETSSSGESATAFCAARQAMREWAAAAALGTVQHRRYALRRVQA